MENKNCPTCHLPVGNSLEEIIPKRIRSQRQQQGYAKAKITTLQKIRLECTDEVHAEKSKSMRYCNLCHRGILPNVDK